MSGSKAGLTEDWCRWGEGVPPTLAWNFASVAPLVALRWARETGEVLAADAVGGMSLRDSAGRLAH
ncbi:MAG: hypothetical protein ACK5EA_18470, partial [Planctomycetaceae bacterium]